MNKYRLGFHAVFAPAGEPLPECQSTAEAVLRPPEANNCSEVHSGGDAHHAPGPAECITVRVQRQQSSTLLGRCADVERAELAGAKVDARRETDAISSRAPLASSAHAFSDLDVAENMRQLRLPDKPSCRRRACRNAGIAIHHLAVRSSARRGNHRDTEWNRAPRRRVTRACVYRPDEMPSIAVQTFPSTSASPWFRHQYRCRSGASSVAKSSGEDITESRRGGLSFDRSGQRAASP